MTSSTSRMITIHLDTEILERQLATLRLFCSQVGFALDTALVSLHEIRECAPNDGLT